MTTVRGATDRFAEFEGSGFGNKQAVVLAIAIDETVEDRLEGVIAPVLVRFDRIDARFDRIDARFEGIDSKFEGIDSKFEGIDSKFEGVNSKFEGVNSKFEGVNSKLEAIHDRLGSRKYEIAVITVTLVAALIGTGIGVYEYVVKPMFG